MSRIGGCSTRACSGSRATFGATIAGGAISDALDALGALAALREPGCDRIRGTASFLGRGGDEQRGIELAAAEVGRVDPRVVKLATLPHRHGHRRAPTVVVRFTGGAGQGRSAGVEACLDAVVGQPRLPPGRRCRASRHRRLSGSRFSRRTWRLANSSWSLPESSRTSEASSTVPSVAQIGPPKPGLDHVGDEPAVVEVGVGQQDRVDRRSGRRPAGSGCGSTRSGCPGTSRSR